MVALSPRAMEVIKLSNYGLLGINVDWDDIPAETLHYVEYFGMRRRAHEEQLKFEALFEGLSKILSKLFK